MANVREELRSLYGAAGAHAYFGESVTTLEHSLQAAHFARQEDAPDALVLAALLHDIGHLIGSAPTDFGDWHGDARHEEIGARWLQARFGAEVFEPVRLHVPAKRFLCAKESGYFEQLSEASVHTLELQGGPMSEREVAAFESQTFWREAIRLRRWDDRGKIPGLPTPDFAEYADLIDALRR